MDVLGFIMPAHAAALPLLFRSHHLISRMRFMFAVLRLLLGYMPPATHNSRPIRLQRSMPDVRLRIGDDF